MADPNSNLKINLDVWKYPTEGYLRNTYSPLRTLVNENNKIVDFNVNSKDLNISSRNLIFECQPSYDGTVNLIFNDDTNPPRIINTRFSKKENDTYKIINRVQTKQTNLYNLNKIDSQTRLIKNANTFPVIDLLGLLSGGQLKGGNYTLYLKYVDSDYNESPIVCESGQISVFHGYHPSNISAALGDEIVQKTIKLYISNLDTSYNSFKLYCVRNYSDINGTRLTEAFVFSEPFVFSTESIEVSITGYETTEPIDINTINIRFQSFDSVKTQAQNQNLLFFGNVERSKTANADLQNCSYFIKLRLKQSDSIGFVGSNYSYKDGSEYYDTNNIYYRLGYWPGEYYRLGIVYILNDDSLTNAYSLRGCVFNNIEDCNLLETDVFKNGDKYTTVPVNTWINKNERLFNSFGVFKNPEITIHENQNSTKPLYYEAEIPLDVKLRLKELGVKGFFFVRQKRIPTIYGQGISFGIDKTSHSPMILRGETYLSEGFLTKDEYNPNITVLKSSYKFEPMYSSDKTHSCLISLDADISKDTQSVLNGENFVLEKVSSGIIVNNDRSFSYIPNNDSDPNKYYSVPAIYVKEGTPHKFVGNYAFSTKFGTAEEVKVLSFFGKDITWKSKIDQGGDPDDYNWKPDQKEILQNIYNNEKAVFGGQNKNILRGIYTGIIGICADIEDSCCYNIRIPGFNKSKNEQYFIVRKNDTSPFYAISNRQVLDNIDNSTLVDVYRGDCYSNTVTVRLLRNFIDPEVPLQDTVVDPKTWAKHYAGYLQMSTGKGDETLDITYEDDKKVSGDWNQINRSDVNAVPLGMWFTYKCLSSDNLGLRAIDRNYVDEQALIGNPRSFYPLNGLNMMSSGKTTDSLLFNKGYSSTVGTESHLPYVELPYVKELFDNRIAFSNIQTEDDFQNGYRVFQNLAYKDIDRQYGAIVKLMPWDSDLLCIFEHGIGIVPVNQKALMSTTTGQSIHLYGTDVLQKQVTVISDTYGSVWQESIIQTPFGIYGVDTFAKKIWRYSRQKGFETISDMVVQRFLNDNVLLDENLSNSIHCLRNVKSHYNDYKGDVMFTFYNYSKNVEWNLCYNERLGKWITKYSWIPMYSENINNIYYSFDKHRCEVLAQIGQLGSENYGLKMLDSKTNKIGCIYGYGEILHNNLIQTNLALDEHVFIPQIKSGETSYLDESGKEIIIPIDVTSIRKFIEVNSNPSKVGSLSFDVDGYKLWWKSQFDKGGSKKYLKFDYFYINDEKISLQEYSASEALELINKRYDNDYTLEQLFEKDGFWGFYEEIEIYEEPAPPTELPLWLRLNITTDVFYNISNDSDLTKSAVSRSYVLCFIADSSKLNEKDRKMYDEMFINGVYVHGRAGIFDEIDYTDDSLNNQILPTKWYDKQEPFEFEFVINDPIGLHKIFENLTIISNNVAPESIQFEIEGDAYSVWKTIGYKNVNPTYDKNLKKQQYKNNTLFKNASVKWDTILNQYSILMTQECKSIEKFGRRLGNMHYKEDSWYITIDPLLLNKNGKTTSTKLRDKYLKVRVRYSGEDLAVITAIKSVVNLSAS